jgi:predicted nucleic acid-binding protein
MGKFVDSNVLIYAFTPHKDSDKCREILFREDVIINALVLIETFAKVHTITKDKKYSIDMMKTLISLGNVKILPIDTNLIFEGMRKIMGCNLFISDVLHYMTALYSNCSAIVSYDKDFDNLLILREEP